MARIPADAVRPLPEGIGGLSGRYLRGVAQSGERLVLVVDVPELLATDVVPDELAAEPAPLDAAPGGATTEA